MRVVTWNVNGLRARWDDVGRFVALHRPDVLCLQEIKATAAQVPEPLTGLPDYHNHYHGGVGGYSGVSIHVRRSLVASMANADRPTFSVPSFDFESRIVCAAFGDVFIASTYVPNGGKDYGAKQQFLADLETYSREHPKLIIAGDLNVALTDLDVHESMRKDKAIGQRQSERAQLTRVIEGGKRDVLREAYPENDDVFTWWPPWRDEKKNNRGWRIDFVLAPTSLADSVSNVAVMRDFGSSDHAPLSVTFGL